MTKSTYPNLDLGLIGNCTFGGLIDRMGRIVWCCLPRFDSKPVFTALMTDEADPTDGVFAIEVEDFARSEQAYVPNTAILKTTLHDAHGHGVEITDFAPRFLARGRVFRPRSIVRIVRPLDGATRVRVRLRPHSDWGTNEPTITHGSNHIRYVTSDYTMRLTTDAPVDYVLHGTPFLLDRPMAFILGPDETVSEGTAELATEFEIKTEDYWRTWTRRLALPLEWQDAVIRAAITLKLCVFEETGAIIAAMTTSIPEAPNSGRNWDYRYCWLRDAFFVVRALNRLAEVGTMEDYLRWLNNIVSRMDDTRLQPVYGIGLEAELSEATVDSVPGYRAMGPVRVGNQAHEHFQHDVYGNVIMGAAQAYFDRRLLRRPGIDDFKRLETVGGRALKLHDAPDAGMWELRTRQRVHTSSSIMCWAACDRLAKIAGFLELDARAKYWRKQSDMIRDTILKEAWSEDRQVFAESFGGSDLDAGVLLMAEVGIIDPTDPRFVSTVHKLEETLGDGPHMRRYEAPDDFGPPGDGLQRLRFLADRRAGADRRARPGARNIRSDARSAQPSRVTIGRRSPQDRRAVGELPADLFDGRHHQRRDALEQTLGQLGMSRLVVVSNRVGNPRDGASAGGLAVALSDTMSDEGGVWFGWSGEVVEDDASPRLQTKEIGKITLATTDMTPAEYEGYYLGFANQVLWPLFHYRLDLAYYHSAQLDEYRRVNRRFAEFVRNLIEPDDDIWIHDYHLIPLAAELRAMDVRNQIGFFLHIPLPPPQVLLTLPQSEWLVRSLFAYDLVGFQTTIDRRHFKRYVVEALGGRNLGNGVLECGGSSVVAHAFPVGIDVEPFRALANSRPAKQAMARAQQRNLGRVNIIGVDRLDYSKGLPQRLLAFERLLECYPENRGNVILTQVAPPTREGVEAYDDIRTELEQLSGSINGRFGDFDWTPVRYIHRTVARRTLAALFASSRVGIVTPLRDGMNLVAKEYVAAQDADDPGVLVLSRFAGAAETMTDALIVNPYDIDEVAEALQRALRMPLEERRERHANLFERVSRFDNKRWASEYLASLRACSESDAAA